jgi:hypothetical protein
MKFRLFAVVLLAMSALGALTAASASAVTFLLAEWLWNGNPVTSELLVDVEGELLLEDTKLATDVLCSGILDGWVGVNGEDLITAVLNLNGIEIGAPLTGTALECINEKGCENPLVWPDNLPWPTLLELMEDTEIFFVILMFGSSAPVGPGWDVECMSIIPTSELCEAPAGAAVKATNEATNVDGEFSEVFTELAGFKLANCTVGGTETGIVEGLGIILDTEGGNLQVSSEP